MVCKHDLSSATFHKHYSSQYIPTCTKRDTHTYTPSKPSSLMSPRLTIADPYLPLLSVPCITIGFSASKEPLACWQTVCTVVHVHTVYSKFQGSIIGEQSEPTYMQLYSWHNFSYISNNAFWPRDCSCPRATCKRNKPCLFRSPSMCKYSTIYISCWHRQQH